MDTDDVASFQWREVFGSAIVVYLLLVFFLYNLSRTWFGVLGFRRLDVVGSDVRVRLPKIHCAGELSRPSVGVFRQSKSDK